MEAKQTPSHADFETTELFSISIILDVQERACITVMPTSPLSKKYKT